MNIAIFGWYHHQNAGDDRMQSCLTRWLDGHTLAFLPAGRPPPIELLRTYDAVLIGGGGLIARSGGLFRGMAAWVRATRIPVGLAGVSVERYRPGAESRDTGVPRCLLLRLVPRHALARTGGGTSPGFRGTRSDLALPPAMRTRRERQRRPVSGQAPRSGCPCLGRRAEAERRQLRSLAPLL